MGIEVLFVISEVILIVRSRRDPPAPYVTEMKSGFIEASEEIASQSLDSPASSFGGKNSKE